jgi:hypothetical protein
MSIKVKSCFKCWSSYTRELWMFLELVEIDKADGAETRKCAHCGARMTLDVEYLGQLDLRTDAERIAEAHKMMAKARRRVRLRRARPQLIAAAGLVLLVLVALALW